MSSTSKPAAASPQPLLKQLLLTALLVAASCYSALRAYSTPLSEGPTTSQVWWFGWVTMLSTGLGAAPMLFVQGVSDHLLGVSNAVAAGMMTSASAALLQEGLSLPSVEGASCTSAQAVAIGVGVGMLSVLLSQRALAGCEDVSLGIMEGVDVRKALLIVVVMTMHSFSEGLGIGVSFGGSSPPQLGMLVTTTLAVHNVPEGFAVSVVLVSRGMSVLGAALWSVLTSLPQPIMAIAGFLFVDEFVVVQPAGLGFAAGAMLYVAWLELAREAVDACGPRLGGAVGVASAGLMWKVQEYL